MLSHQQEHQQELRIILCQFSKWPAVGSAGEFEHIRQLLQKYKSGLEIIPQRHFLELPVHDFDPKPCFVQRYQQGYWLKIACKYAINRESDRGSW